MSQSSIPSNYRNEGTCPTCLQSRSAAHDRDKAERERDDYCRQLTAGIPQMREVCNERDRLARENEELRRKLSERA